MARSDDVFQNEKKYIRLSNSVIIKPYISKNEKGVLLIKFEREHRKILDYDILKIIQDRYHIVILPSWSGLFTVPVLSLAARSRDRFYVMPVHANERELCSRLGPNCLDLPFNNASWVNKDFFSGYKGQRDIPCLMVANFAEFKRHWILFKALSKLPLEITAVCVGLPLDDGRTADSLRQEAREYGVSDRVQIIEKPAQEDLRNYFQRAKVFCALSRKEGTFNAVAESLMAGTPVLMFKNAQIGTKDLINSKNGALVDSISDLREKILYFNRINNHDDIRVMAQGMVDAETNCSKLNQLLKDFALSRGEGWSCDIEKTYCMRLNFYYKSPDWRSRLNDDYAYLKNMGIEVKGFVQ